MKRFVFSILASIAFAACNDVPTPNGSANGTIDGYVFVSSAVGGVTVTAFAYDAQTGRPGAQLTQSTPTTNDGKFHLELGYYAGPLVLEARGAGAAYLEASTGVSVNWNTGNVLRAVFVKGALPSLNFTMDAGDASTLVISPFSDLAVNYAEARLAHHRETVFTDSLAKSYSLFREHLEYDFWSVVPADLTSGGMRSLDITVQAGAELAGLSMLVKLTDDELGTQGHSTLQLEELLRRDIVGGTRDQTDGHCVASSVADVPIFDGCDANGSELALAPCPNPMVGCRYTPMSNQSLRRDFAHAAGYFLDNDPRNMSGVQTLAMNDLLQRIDGRESELFPGPGDHSFDVTPPTVTVVETTVGDETNSTISFFDPDPFNAPWGAVNYGTPPTTVRLNGASGIRFGKFAPRYVPGSQNLPTWHFLVADNRSPAAAIRLEARLLRDDGTGNFAELAPFQDISSVSGAGYNRELLIDTNLSPVVGVRSGTYKLEYRAIDEVGNVSMVQSVQWVQQILPPPIRQREGAACSGTVNNVVCASRFCLGDSGCASPNGANLAINASEVLIASGTIDNPNSIPVRVQLVASGCYKYQVGQIWQHPAIQTSAAAQRQCDGTGCNTPPACYSPDLDAEHVLAGYGFVTGFDGSYTSGGLNFGPLPPCPTCGPFEVEIPPTSTATIWLTTGGYHFAFPTAPGAIPPFASTDSGSWPSTPSVTGALGPIWEEWSLRQPCPTCGLQCGAVQKHQSVHFVTRISVTPNISVLLSARPKAPPAGFDDEPLAPAKGTNVSQFAYTPSPWATAENGFAPFAVPPPTSCGGGGQP